MALTKFSTLPAAVVPNFGTINKNVGYRINYCGGPAPGKGGKSVPKVIVEGGTDATTNENGQGYTVNGNAFAESKADGLHVNRAGRKDGRLVTVAGNMYDIDVRDGTLYYPGNSLGCHIRNVGSVSFLYTNAESSEQRYAANLSRVMLMYAAWGSYSPDAWKAHVFDATIRQGTSAQMGNIPAGDTFYSFSISNTNQARVIDEKMTLEGVSIEFNGNESPGCCTDKNLSGRVWQVTPIPMLAKGGFVSTSNPSLLMIPSHPNRDISRDRVATQLIQLSTQP